MKYRKKPVVVEAIHYRGKQDDSLLKSFVDSHCLYRDGDTYKWLIATPEGDHQITDGDYIIKGVKGEFYPCKPDIFEMTYESAENGCFQNGNNHIALTVEEAKVIANALLTYERLFKGAINASSNSERDSLPLSCNLQKRIEQAQIRHLKREINQLKEDQARDNFYRQQFLKNAKQAEKS